MLFRAPACRSGAVLLRLGLVLALVGVLLPLQARSADAQDVAEPGANATITVRAYGARSTNVATQAADADYADGIAGAVFEAWREGQLRASCTTVEAGTCDLGVAAEPGGLAFEVRQVGAPAGWSIVDTLAAGMNASAVGGAIIPNANVRTVTVAPGGAAQLTGSGWTGTTAAALNAAGFLQIRDNPTPQPTGDDCAFDIGMLLDVSFSVQQAPNGRALFQQAVESFVDSVEESGNRLSFFRFGNQGQVVGPGGSVAGNPAPEWLQLPGAYADARSRAGNTYAGQFPTATNGTNLDNGFFSVLNAVGGDFTAPDILLLVTDGNPTYVGDPFQAGSPLSVMLRDVHYAAATANALKDQGTRIITVAAGAVTDEIGRLMSGGPNSYLSGEFAEVVELLGQITDVLCSAAIVVDKEVGAGDDWRNGGAGWSFTLDGDETLTTGASGEVVYTILPDDLGNDGFTVTEGAVPDGFEFLAATCVDGEGAVVSQPSGTQGVVFAGPLAIGEQIRCTFRNLELAAVVPVAAADTTSGPQGVPQTIDPLANDAPGDPAVPLDPGTLTLLDPDTGDEVASVTVPEGVYTLGGSGIVFTPNRDFVGTATPVDYRVRDVNGNPAESIYTPTFTSVVPDAEPDVTSGPQGAPQTIDPLANDAPGDPGVPLDPDTLTLLDGDGNPVSEVVVSGQGTYTLGGDGIVFTPEPTFSGTADPVGYRVLDANGTPATSTHTPTVTPVAQPDTTEDIQGALQTVDPLVNDTLDENITLVPGTLQLVDPVTGDPSSSVTVPGQGTYTVVDGQIQFQPEPQFTGPATPVIYLVDDTDGNTIGSTYTPTVIPVEPGANPDATSGPQGIPQSVDPLANDLPGDPDVPLDPSTLTLLDAAGNAVDTVTVPQGVYTLVDGQIVFTPDPQFVGTATPVDYRVLDANGTPTESTYTPTFTPVEPVANPDQTSGPQGVPQSINPIANDAPGDPDVPLDPGSLTLLDGEGNPTASVTVPGQGVYTVEDGLIVFTPEPSFVATADPVDYRISDINGTPAVSTYTPTTTPVTPVAEPDVSTGPLNTPQSVDPLANDTPGDPAVPLDPTSLTLLDPDTGEPTVSVTVPGQGTYTIEDGRLVFTPETGFVGTATPVDYRVSDVNGTPTESTYTPTVAPGPPVRLDLDQRHPRGDAAEFDPVAQDPDLAPSTIFLLDPDGDPVRELVVPGEGTWTVDPDTGRITFVPVDGLTGDPTPVTWVGSRTDGTPVEGTLTVTYFDPDDDDPPPVAPPPGEDPPADDDDTLGDDDTRGGEDRSPAARARLPFTGASMLLLSLLGLAGLLTGGVVLRRSRRVGSVPSR